MKTSLPLVLAVALAGCVGGLADRSSAQAAAKVGISAEACGPIEGSLPVADGSPVTSDLARVSEDDARAAALLAVPGTTVTAVDLDEEDGFLVYDVDLVHEGSADGGGPIEVDVVVDAGSGEVLCTELD
ncbi:PepSY domain-containing protein [Rubrivirga marina]|uniref:PepSY domain-containing protein n=1 Tax=Rubrivirga marina TaxID=1196024 RepID=A0A271ISI7_9BACT|nr:PepSY domain-containing protein [Rubrivirga marina]PAP74202.1 hypothetical protein BSZ37_21310 [Rubrivirga marina]